MGFVKHTLDVMPEYDKPVLLLLDIENEPTYIWTVGEWTCEGWITYDDWAAYTVIEWYDLPERNKPSIDGKVVKGKKK